MVASPPARDAAEHRWQAGHEHPAPSEQVTGTAAEQQQPAERQGIRVDHPLQAAVGESECGLNVRQRDVDYGRVQHDHQLGGRDDQQRHAKTAAVVPRAGLRIARELHDSLTHSISVIQVQAGVAVHLARKRGEDVPPALLAIQEAGADAVRELRATLGVLRSEEDGDGSGLSQLDSLVARARAAGLPVTVTVSGAKRPLPPEVDQAAYRIVQEALTNVSRHAGQACASVHLHYAAETLSIQVSDDGQGAATRPSGPGLGLVGMRERVSALGGQLHAGPKDDGGFGVRAELPARAPS